MKVAARHTIYVKDFLTKHSQFIILLSITGFFLFFHFFQLQIHSSVGWDQTDSAWAAESILNDKPFRLTGVPIKGNAGLTLGPLYYYLITPFYWATNLDMSASALFAAFIATSAFFIFYTVTKNIFGRHIALIATFLYAFSPIIQETDRVQAAFVLVPTLSYLIFYYIYKLVRGQEKYVVYLAAAIGIGFHFHITTLFYFPILLFMLPFLPRTKHMISYGVLASGVFLLFMSPLLMSYLSARSGQSGNIIEYVSASYHGFHLRRVIQLAHDAFITFEWYRWLRPYVFIIPLIYGAVHTLTVSAKNRRSAYVMMYLMALWIIIPWLLLSTYSGELTWYYFSLPRNISFIMIASLVYSVWTLRYMFTKVLLIVLCILYMVAGIQHFRDTPPGNYLSIKSSAIVAIQKKWTVKFADRDPYSYMVYVFRTYGYKPQ